MAIESDRDRLAATFRRFAVNETRENLSPLYEGLSLSVADDADLLELASHALPGQPPPNMLFAAVQYLLFEHPENLLANWYPSVSGHAAAAGDPRPAFRSFALDHRHEVVALLRRRMVQTNEVRRSALLFPAFVEVLHETKQPLALIEIGASAGLNLLFDRYGYRYGSLAAGITESPVQLDCLTEGPLPPLNQGFPSVASRAGIDLRPIDVTDGDDVRWLRALIWPEHHDRRALLDAALAVARVDPPRVLQGDAVDLLAAQVRSAPPHETACIVATFVLNQLSQEQLRRLDATTQELSSERELFIITLGWNPLVSPPEAASESWTSLSLLSYRRGARSVRHLARCNPHGRSIAWTGARSA